MKHRVLPAIALIAIVAVLTFPVPGSTQQPCPPGSVPTPEGCRPAPPHQPSPGGQPAPGPQPTPGAQPAPGRPPQPSPQPHPQPPHMPGPQYMPPPVPEYAPPPPVYDPNLRQVAQPYVSVFTCPGGACPATTTLVRGTFVRILAWQGPFVLVQVPDTAIEGWVDSRYLTP